MIQFPPDRSNQPGHLTLCDIEPIHTPGAIQPQGVLLVARLCDLIITHVSENLADFVGLQPTAAMGRPLHVALGEQACRAIQNSFVNERYAPSAVVAVNAPLAPFPLHMVANAANGTVYIELEAAPDDREQGLVIQRTQAIMHALHAAGSQQDLSDIVAAKLRELTGYDRVMVYRFDREGNGEVISEDREADLEPYLGLHYPASDIPTQARRMYLAQRVRAIADVDYVPVPLLADPALDDAAPTDMTVCALRSVSPAHLDYMRNMGTQASLGVSLISGGSLWGLLVCHHRTPLIITADLRAQCDLIGQLMSLLLGSMGQMERYGEQLRRQRMLHEVVARMINAEHVADAFLESGEAILSMLDASGAVVRLGERTVTLGLTPAIQAVMRVMSTLNAEANGDLIAIDELQEYVADWSNEVAIASGALYLPLRPDSDDGIIWFRPEMERQVDWGGDPTKALALDPTTGRVSPRRSFAVWRERVGGRSEPWQEADRAIAREIRRTVTMAVGREAVAELASQALKLSEETMRSAMAAATIGMALVSPTGKWLMVNPALSELLGYSVVDLRQTDVQAVIHADDLDRTLEMVRQMLAGEISLHRSELRCIHQSGRIVWVYLTASLVAGHGGTSSFFVWQLQDITERKQIAIMQDEFVSTVNHELRTPLSSVYGAIRLLKEKNAGQLDQKGLRLLELADQSCVRLSNLVNDILDLEKISAGKMVYLLETLDLGTLVQDIVTRHLGLAERYEVSFMTKLEVHDALVTVDPNRFNQSLVNLLSNAAKYSPKGDVVMISVGLASPGWVRVSVTDRGPGIPESFRARMFERFAQADSSATRKVGGSGLGLNITKRIIEAFGGTVTFDTDESQGTTFHFDLPLHVPSPSTGFIDPPNQSPVDK